MRIELDNHTKHMVDLESLENISQDLTSQDIELIITDDQYIQQINKDYRSIDKPTDVLSFPFEKMPGAPLGSIIISIDFVEKRSKELGHTFDEELILLYIHGLLHCLGYDHEVDAGEHRKKEEELIEKYNLPKSLIVRTQE